MAMDEITPVAAATTMICGFISLLGIFITTSCSPDIEIGYRGSFTFFYRFL